MHWLAGVRNSGLFEYAYLMDYFFKHQMSTISSPEFLRLFVSGWSPGYPGDQPLTKSRRNSGFEIANEQGMQPRPQGLLSGQNGWLEKTLANSRSRVSKNIGDFNLFNMAEGSVSHSHVKTGNTSNWTLKSVDLFKIFILILLLSFYFPNLSLQNLVK